MYTAFVIGLVVGCIAVIFARSKHKRKTQQKVVEGYVTDIFSRQSYRPEVRAGYTYGIPSFTLRFRSDDEKEHAIANGLTEQFVRKVQALCGNLQARNEAFDAERAVAIYSAEDEQRWAEKASAYRIKSEK